MLSSSTTTAHLRHRDTRNDAAAAGDVGRSGGASGRAGRRAQMQTAAASRPASWGTEGHAMSNTHEIQHLDNLSHGGTPIDTYDEEAPVYLCSGKQRLVTSARAHELDIAVQQHKARQERRASRSRSRTKHCEGGERSRREKFGYNSGGGEKISAQPAPQRGRRADVKAAGFFPPCFFDAF